MVLGLSKEERKRAAKTRAESRTYREILEKKAKLQRRQGYAEGYLKSERAKARAKGASGGSGSLFSGLVSGLSSTGAQNIGAGARSYIMEGFPGSAPKRKGKRKGHASALDDYSLF